MSLPHFKPISASKYYDEPIYACEECKKLGYKNIGKYYHNDKQIYLCNKHIHQLLRKQKLEKICQRFL